MVVTEAAWRLQHALDPVYALLGVPLQYLDLALDDSVHLGASHGSIVDERDLGSVRVALHSLVHLLRLGLVLVELVAISAFEGVG